jgi:hypothetical protein
MLRHINRSGTPEWIDVCLYNPYQVTIRSFTNDLDFIPQVAGYSYDEDIGFEVGEDILVMSNEMPKLSHQALNFFSQELDNDFRTFLHVDVDILGALAADSGLNTEDISLIAGLEGNYVLSILKDVLNRNNYNFDWLDDADLVDANGNEIMQQTVMRRAKELIESSKLKNKENTK